MKYVVFLLLLSAPLTLMAQEAPSEQVEAMKKLDFLVGHWEGDGWIQRGPDQRFEFRGTEIVEHRLDGLVVLVEGLHKTVIPETNEERVIHHAFGVFSYDAESGGYRFRTHLTSGRGGDFEAHMEGDALIWGMENPQAGTIRYTIHLNEDGDWFEIGEASRDDGETWFQFFEMTLKRVESTSETH